MGGPNDPDRKRAYQIAWRKRNAEYTKLWGARHRAANRKRYRLARIEARFGLDVIDYLVLRHLAGGRCEICGRKLKMFGPKAEQDCIDHDHSTDKVRGLLCLRCNAGIGLLQDDPDVLDRAYEYVRGHKAVAQPKYRLSISNRDKSERTFEDYKGNERTSKYETIGAIFENEDGRLSVAVDRKFKFDPSKEWLNLYVVEKRDEDDEDEKPKAKKAAKSKVKKQTKKSPPPDEDDETDPFADDVE